MGLFKRAQVSYPPTKYGYLPPAEAEVLGWECSSRACSNSDAHASDLRRWPSRCDKCGASISSGNLAEPWRAEARRVEIDERLTHPVDDIDRERAELDDLDWRFKAAVGQGDFDLASEVRIELDALLRRRFAASPGAGHTMRVYLVLAAIRAGDLDNASAELLEWYSLMDFEGRQGFFESQAWGLRAVDFLEHPESRTHPARTEVHTSLDGIVARYRGDLNAQLEDGYKRVRVIH